MAVASLNSILLANDKKGLFKRADTNLGYPTNFMPFDHRNGHMLNSYDVDDNLVCATKNIGFFGGTFNTIIGKTGVAKTTFAVQSASNISQYCYHRYGMHAQVYHLDMEQTYSYSRIQAVTKRKMSDLQENFILIQDVNRVEHLHNMFNMIYQAKENNKKDFMINTGVKNEFNEDIKCYIPTIVIIDALPSLSIAEIEKDDELAQGTYSNRVAKSIAAFYKQNMALVRKYNIICFVINHINAKIEINAMAKTQPQSMYLKMDESLPCGAAPMYFAHNIIKIVSKDKKMADKDGFDGFLARFEFLKARTNKAGQSCEMVYDQELGYDARKTLYNMLDNENLISGRNPYRYVEGFPDVKFDSRNIDAALDENPDLYKAMYFAGLKISENVLSNIKFNPTDENTDLISLAARLSDSQENE